MAGLSSKPLVSVITVCLNAADIIERTIQSVMSQGYPDIEYIVMDGGSNDGTLDIIRRYDNHLSYWVSEKDAGISDAFNKGFLVSKGRWIAYLNAGDVYYNNNAIDNLMACSDKNDIIYGGLESFKKRDKELNYYYPNDVHKDIYWLKDAIPHQSCIVSREVFNKIGLFDPNMKFAMDYEFFLRAHISGFKFKAIHEIITHIDTNGVSANFWKKQLKEFLSAQKKHKILPWLQKFYYYKRYARTYMYSKLGYF